MKAFLVTAPGQGDWADIAPPRPAANEALVRIEVCGICNSTDSELLAGTQPYRPALPFALGHESVGTVIEVGADVTRYRVGDRVTRAACILPGEQRDGIASGWGGFAEYGLVRQADDNYTSQRQVVLPMGVAPEDAFLAISLAETRAWLEQVTEQMGPLDGPVIVVGTGIAGLTATHWAARLGGRPVITLGRREERLAMARERGADWAFRSDDPALEQQVREATGGRMASCLVEAIGKPKALPGLAPLLAPGAVVAIYGAAAAAEYEAAVAQLPTGVRVTRPGPEEHRYTRQVAEELGSGKIDPALWRTHTWSADQIHEAFAQVAAGEVLKGCVQM